MADEPAGGEGWPLLAGLSQPGGAVDDLGCIVFLNARAEAFWGVRLADVLGRRARDVLGIRPRDDRPLNEWVASVVRPAIEGNGAFPARTVAADGRVHLVEMTAVRQARGGRLYAQFVLSERGMRADIPPAPRDPATGLPTLRPGTHDRGWSGRGGVLVMFDLEALRETNALYGSWTGDAVLAAAGRVLGEEAPQGALAARCGADELVLVLSGGTADEVDRLARRVVERVAREARQAGVPVAPRLHYGIAPFRAGGMAPAVQQALDALYERRRALLRAASGGRIVITREGRAALQEPATGGTGTGAGTFASNFRAEWGDYFRQAYARATDQAREFVALVDPRPGSAVVEVGAGGGRVSFDGGLAERVGREGQLLLTDPSAAQLQAARNRAAELGMRWVRFLCAPVEALPLAPATADLCLGSTFLHFTDPPEAIRGMARVVRRGGRVAVDAIAGADLPPMWLEILQPVLQTLQAHGRPMAWALSRSELERLFEASGLAVEAVDESADEVIYPSAEVAVQVMRQTRAVALLLRGFEAGVVHEAEEAVDQRLRDAFARARPEEFTATWAHVQMVGRR